MHNELLLLISYLATPAHCVELGMVLYNSNRYVFPSDPTFGVSFVEDMGYLSVCGRIYGKVPLTVGKVACLAHILNVGILVEKAV